MSLTGYLSGIASAIRRGAVNKYGKIHASSFPSLIENECNANYEKGLNEGYINGEKSGIIIGRNEGLSEGYEHGFEEGRISFYDEFWIEYLDGGNRENYIRAFCGPGWNDITFKPKQNIIPTLATHMFERSHITNLTEKINECGIKLDFSYCTNISQMFLNNSIIVRIPEINTSSLPYGTSLSNLFNGCKNLITIDNLHLRSDFKYDNSTFGNCFALRDLNITGTIGQNGFVVSWCHELSKDSLLNILNALEDYSKDTSETQWKITLGKTNIAKLTSSELEIATKKGWVVE